MTVRVSVLAAAGLSLSLLALPVTAQSINNPIPGIDIVVKKNPSGRALVVGQSGRDGHFSGSVRVENGEYQVSAACPARRRCPDFRLASVSVDGRRIEPDARGGFAFPVGASLGQVRLTATVIGYAPLRPAEF